MGSFAVVSSDQVSRADFVRAQLQQMRVSKINKFHSTKCDRLFYSALYDKKTSEKFPGPVAGFQLCEM